MNVLPVLVSLLECAAKPILSEATDCGEDNAGWAGHVRVRVRVTAHSMRCLTTTTTAL